MNTSDIRLNTNTRIDKPSIASSSNLSPIKSLFGTIKNDKNKFNYFFAHYVNKAIIKVELREAGNIRLFIYSMLYKYLY